MKTTISLTSKRFLKVTRFLIRLTRIKARFKNENNALLYMRVKGQKPQETNQVLKTLQIRSTIKTSLLNDLSYYEINEASTHSSIIVFLHGGAFVEAALPQHLQFVDHLAISNDISIIVPLYPRLPISNAEHCLNQLKDLLTHLSQTQSSKSIILMGDSAGGWLALSLAKIMAQELNISSKHVILLSPWCDLTMSSADKLLEKKDPILSHLGLKTLGKQWTQNHPSIGYEVGDDLSHIHHLQLFVGTYEIFLSQTRKLYDQAIKQEVETSLIEYEGLFHDFMLFPFHESNHVLQSIHDILNQNK
jgi:acetyl esterase/lipase